MSRRSIRRIVAAALRALPAVTAAAVLAAALIPRSRDAIAREVPVLSFWNPLCDVVLQQADSASTYGLSPNWSVYQPLGETGNPSQVTQRISDLQYGPIYSGAFTMIVWDSTTHAPDPTSLVLRTTHFNFSRSGDMHTLNSYLNPPLVLRNHQGVADPLRGTVAMRLENTAGIALSVDFDPEGDATLPTAFLQNGINPLQPVPGAHAVDAHAFCGGDAGLQALRVMQAVSTTNAQDFTTAKLFLQRFRVPAQCEVRWLELAFALGGGGGYGNQGRQPTVALIDLQGVPDPPPRDLPEPLVQAVLSGSSFPAWQSHVDFDHVVTLSPDHDYGLLVDAGGFFVPGMRQLTGREGFDFTSAIFRLSERDTTADEWTTRAARALSFRLIGAPVLSLDAPGASGVVTLRLRAQPNPARGAVLLTIAGARGPVELEVLDARGRRVASGTSQGDRWLWPGSDASGRPLPAGVYFVRARGEDGVAIGERVVLVR